MPTMNDKQQRQYEKQQWREIKRARWAKKSLAEKLASIWLVGLCGALITTIGGGLIGMFVWMEFDLGFRTCLPVNIGIVLVLITGLALWIEGAL